MAGMLQLVTSTELPVTASKGGSPALGELSLHSAHAAAGTGVGSEKRIWEGIRRGDAVLAASVQSVGTQLAAKSLTWTFELTPTITVGYPRVQNKLDLDI